MSAQINRRGFLKAQTVFLAMEEPRPLPPYVGEMIRFLPYPMVTA